MLASRRSRRIQDGVISFQAHYRGILVRRTHRTILLSRMEASQRFQAIWERALSLMKNPTKHGEHASSWASFKYIKHDVMQASDIWGDGDLWTDTSRALDEATERALQNPGSFEVAVSELAVVEDSNIVLPRRTKVNAAVSCHDILLTKAVVNWLRIADRKSPMFRQFFVRRLLQLGAGERSRTLAKRLTGSTNIPIYETYLEQKSGFRILWTEGAKEIIMIWYVSSHDKVSRYMHLIDLAEKRRCRQNMTSFSSMPELQQDCEQIHLDPVSDTPLKVYEVRYDELEDMANVAWSPRLHLTIEEREIVENKGTTLLLGRSGTGKTICICNRMDYDAVCQKAAEGFSQLFVARSRRLRSYVEETLDKGPDRTFTTFDELKLSLESSLPSAKESIDALFLPSRQMTFARYKRDVYRPEISGEVDALLVWKNLQSFIKGSIEAFQSPTRGLSEQQYLNIGKKRCRLTPAQRTTVYEAFERYDKYMKEMHLWDDCDRVSSLLRRLTEAQQSDRHLFEELRYSKIYVDEVQDYTQMEILLFFYLSGPGDLFLAGDPAQSVVEGVEFRFEDIRSVGYHYCGTENRKLIPDKPKTVTVNFRSHSGILNTAAAVLSCLFRVFPDSAKQLGEDRGLFQGPRPSVLMKVDVPSLKQLVSKLEGVVVLTHDDAVSRWKRNLD